jgi:hypothetical protein
VGVGLAEQGPRFLLKGLDGVGARGPAQRRFPGIDQLDQSPGELGRVQPLGQALFAPVCASPRSPANQPVNHARFTFLDPRAHDFWIDWDRAADDSVAQLRTEAGRNLYDQGLTGLVGELSTRSEAFRIRWAAHNVRLHRTGLKHFHHPVVGDLHLNFEVMELPADPGLSLLAFSADAGSPDDDALSLLASWVATHDPTGALRAPTQT